MLQRDMTQKQTQPTQSRLLDPKWKYIPAAATDVLARFKAMGWVPPSEAKHAKRS